MVRRHAAMARVLLSPALSIPVMAAAGIATALGCSLIDSAGVGGSLLHLTIGAGLSAALGYSSGSLLAKESSSRYGYQRGAIVLPYGRSTRLGGRTETQSSGLGLTLAGEPIGIKDEVKHFKFIGATGAGKSTAITELLTGALRRGDRAVIADPDGGYFRRFYKPERGDVVLNPFEPQSVKWDPFAELRAPYDAEQLARALIPDHDGADRSWRAYARTFFTAVTQQAHAAGVRDVSELYRLLVVADVDELRVLTKGTPAQPFLDEFNIRMFDSIRSVTSSAVAVLGYVANQRSQEFSVRDWISDPGKKQGVLFIPYRAGQIPALRSAISAWMRIGIFQAMEQPEGDQRLWFVIDELDALGQVDGLKDALARLRKFGGRCVLGFQSVAQVASTYGHGDAHTIIENCGNSLILRCSASEGGGTSRFASTLIGQREVLRANFSTSRRYSEVFGSTTRSDYLALESAVMDSQLEQLPDLTGYLKLASRPEWLQVRLRYPNTSSFRSSTYESSSGRSQHGPAASTAVKLEASAAPEGSQWDRAPEPPTRASTNREAKDYHL
jgi:type IV secretory pathway TraG/TraD family ATPase VirD4